MQLIAVMATMKAVRMHAFGGPEVLEYEDVETPRIGPRDVLLRIEAAAVNPAMEEVLNSGRVTADLKPAGAPATTAQVGDAVCAALGKAVAA